MAASNPPVNPYESSFSQPSANELSPCWTWQGHSIRIEATASRKWLWQVVEYFVVVDEQLRFTNQKLKFREEFDWLFPNGIISAQGRFTALGFNNGLRRRFRITIDDDLVADGAVKIRDGWKGLMVVVAMFMGIGVLIGTAVWPYG